MTRKLRRHSADQIVKKIRDADAMLAAGTRQQVLHRALTKQESVHGIANSTFLD